MEHDRDFRRLAAWGLQTLAVAVAYYAAAQVGLLAELVGGQVTPLWPPTGIAVVALLVLGVRVLPGITVAAFVVNLTIDPSLLTTAIISIGNTLAPMCAYALLRRWNFRIELDRLRDALCLVLLAGVGAMVVSATIGSSALTLAGSAPGEDFWSTWSVWWVGDAMGVIIVAPFLLAARAFRWPVHATFLRWAEAIGLAIGTVGAGVLVTRAEPGLLFLVFPFLIWAALRFQLSGAAPAALAASIIAIDAARDRAGQFADYDLFATMLTLNAFNGSAALTALLLAVITSQRDQAQREIEQACAQLAVAVTSLERRGSAGRRLLDTPQPEHP